ncbi:hypothetical protein U9M48_034197, partial [Paspalum notatum var. saurae]
VDSSAGHRSPAAAGADADGDEDDGCAMAVLVLELGMLPSKHLSGAAKRKKRKRDAQFIESQRGTMLKFISVSSKGDQGKKPDLDLDAQVGVNKDATGEQNLIAQADVNEDTAGEEQLQQPSSDTENPIDNGQEDSPLAIDDPRTWTPDIGLFYQYVRGEYLILPSLQDKFAMGATTDNGRVRIRIAMMRIVVLV